MLGERQYIMVGIEGSLKALFAIRVGIQGAMSLRDDFFYELE